MPRLPIRVSVSERDSRLVRLWPLLDSGAGHNVFDGAVAHELGWSDSDLISRAEDAQPVSGLGRGSAPLIGYLHRLTCYVPLGPRFAVLTIRALFTPPYTLGTPVLGRRDFFEQVDFALVEAERRSYLRFRDPAVLHDTWPDREGG